MSTQDTATTETAAETSGDGSTTEATATEATTSTEATSTDAGEAALGDAGKKALDAMKAKWKTAETAAKETERRLAELQARIDGKEAEHAQAQEAQRIKDEALAAANERIAKAEIRAAAAKALNDPADALRFLSPSDFEVNADGEIDSAQVAQAIADLIKNKPYLAAQGGQRFQGSADGGARDGSAGVRQLTDADLARMTPQQIDKAMRDGQLRDLLGGK